VENLQKVRIYQSYALSKNAQRERTGQELSEHAGVMFALSRDTATQMDRLEEFEAARHLFGEPYTDLQNPVEHEMLFHQFFLAFCNALDSGFKIKVFPRIATAPLAQLDALVFRTGERSDISKTAMLMHPSLVLDGANLALVVCLLLADDSEYCIVDKERQWIYHKVYNSTSLVPRVIYMAKMELIHQSSVTFSFSFEELNIQNDVIKMIHYDFQTAFLSFFIWHECGHTYPSEEAHKFSGLKDEVSFEEARRLIINPKGEENLHKTWKAQQEELVSDVLGLVITERCSRSKAAHLAVIVYFLYSDLLEYMASLIKFEGEIVDELDNLHDRALSLALGRAHPSPNYRLANVLDIITDNCARTQSGLDARAVQAELEFLKVVGKVLDFFDAIKSRVKYELVQEKHQWPLHEGWANRKCSYHKRSGDIIE
jgi:hypothetical protein